MMGIFFIFQIILFGTNVQINGQSCDCSCGNDWVTFGDSCYLFSNAAGMHYVEAEQYCQQHNGAHLVSIETASENTFLRDYASRMNGTQFWIGLTDEMIETVWRWGSVGEKAGYTDWFPGQPDDTSGSEDCAVLEPADQFHWNDRPCINTYRPLCEKSNCDGTNCCPDTWVTYGGSCYLFNNGAGFNFTESQHYCKQHGGVLVTIETSQENTFLKDYISRLNKAYFWMDLTDQQTEGVWKWQTNGQTATFTDWFPGEPNDSAGHEDCAMFFKAGRGYQWNDSPCSDSFHPVCEKK